jgi:hypothetical protein
MALVASKAGDFETTYQVREAFTHKGLTFAAGEVVPAHDPLVREVFEVRPDLFLARATRRPEHRRAAQASSFALIYRLAKEA